MVKAVGVAVNDNPFGVGGLGSIPWPVKLDTVSPTARHRCDVFWSCVAQAQSRRDGPRHSSHASA